MSRTEASNYLVRANGFGEDLEVEGAAYVEHIGPHDDLRIENLKGTYIRRMISPGRVHASPRGLHGPTHRPQPTDDGGTGPPVST